MTAKAFNLQDELKNNEFRVTIFGSARIPKGHDIYEDTYELAGELAKMGVDLVTGGGPGIMQAASTGHKDADTDQKSHSIGINIKLPFEQELNPGLEMFDEHERFSTRLDEFMMLSNVVVVMPGGVGTCLELFYTWQLIQVNHICHIPVIVVGEMWSELMKWVRAWPLGKGNMSPEDMDNIIEVKDGKSALKIIKEAHEAWKENPETCLNWKKYGDLNKDGKLD